MLGDDCSSREVVCDNIQNAECETTLLTCKCSSGYNADSTSTCSPVGKCSYVPVYTSIICYHVSSHDRKVAKQHPSSNCT